MVKIFFVLLCVEFVGSYFDNKIILNFVLSVSELI